MWRYSDQQSDYHHGHALLPGSTVNIALMFLINIGFKESFDCLIKMRSIDVYLTVTCFTLAQNIFELWAET